MAWAPGLFVVCLTGAGTAVGFLILQIFGGLRFA